MTPEREERIREERIRLRALEIWKEEGCPEGRSREHWEQAEREVGGDEGREAGGDQPTNQEARTAGTASSLKVCATPSDDGTGPSAGETSRTVQVVYD